MISNKQIIAMLKGIWFIWEDAGVCPKCRQAFVHKSGYHQDCGNPLYTPQNIY